MSLPQNIQKSAPPGSVLKTKRDHLLQKTDNLTAHDFLRQHTTLIDDYFLTGFAQSAVGPQIGIMHNPYALIALGGYGRSEQCVFSDIDLLILFENKIPAEAENLVREVIYPLWDLGLEVGHVTRTIQDCLYMAHKDHEVLTSILDARFICGMSQLFHQLMDQLRTKVIETAPAKIINRLIEANQVRHDRFGDSAYLLEPNLKEGQGGLRDYHTMLWIARIQANVKQTRDLEYCGYLSHNEFQWISQALNFVWRVRNQLHRMVGRKCDQLHLENQSKLADIMGIKGVNGHLPVEKLMGTLHGHMEFIKQSYAVFIYGLKQKRKLQHRQISLKKTAVQGLKFNRGMINFVSPEAILHNPQLLVDIFEQSAAHKAPLHVEARRLVREFGHLIGQPALRTSPYVLDTFEKILMRSKGAFKVLNDMLDTGFLVHFIPQFKGVVNRIQFDQYHLYPVARHLLLTVRCLKTVSMTKSDSPEPLCRQVYKQIKKKKLLLWAALLHDIGKAEPTSGHADRSARIAEKILKEKGMPPKDINTVVFLVREHLLLFKTATRRDINEEETAVFVARRVGQRERLRMLYVLSVADAIATGPKAWNDWTATLMRSLFLRIRNAMEKGELASRRTMRVIQEKKEQILTAAPSDAQRQADAQLIEMMSPRYLLHIPAQEIPRHMALFRQLQDNDFVWRIDKSIDEQTRTLAICAKDRPGLLARIAGVFTLNNINILGVHIFTWRNHTALDIFKVSAPQDRILEDSRWQRTAQDLQSTLDGRLDLSMELTCKQNAFRSIKMVTKERPQNVVIDNQSSSFFTIVEVTAWDFPGLLHRIADALFRCRLDIWVAQIATHIDQVVDVFYVRTFDGDKIDTPEQEEVVRHAVEAVLQ